MSTPHLLEVLRDARDEGLWQEQSAILAELELDAAYVRHVGGCRPTYTWRIVIEYDDDEYDPVEARRAAMARCRNTDWAAWKSYAVTTTSTRQFGDGILATVVPLLEQLYDDQLAAYQRAALRSPFDAGPLSRDKDRRIALVNADLAADRRKVPR